MSRNYRIVPSWERDARQEAAQRTRAANRMAGPVPGLRDDMRQPWPLVLGDWVRWTIHPDKRHVRRWWATDTATGEPIRDDGVIVRAGVDRLIGLAAEKVPRNMLGRQHWI